MNKREVPCHFLLQERQSSETRCDSPRVFVCRNTGVRMRYGLGPAVSLLNLPKLSQQVAMAPSLFTVTHQRANV